MSPHITSAFRSAATVALVATIVVAPWRPSTVVTDWTPRALTPGAAMAIRASSSVGAPRRPGVIRSVRSDIPTLTEIAPWERDVLAAHARPVLESLLLAGTQTEGDA